MISKRNLITITLLSACIPILYWQLNKVGYFPPINFWLTSENVNPTPNLPPTQLDLLNYERSLLALIPAPID